MHPGKTLAIELRLPNRPGTYFAGSSDGQGFAGKGNSGKGQGTRELQNEPKTVQNGSELGKLGAI